MQYHGSRRIDTAPDTISWASQTGAELPNDVSRPVRAASAWSLPHHRHLSLQHHHHRQPGSLSVLSAEVVVCRINGIVVPCQTLKPACGISESIAVAADYHSQLLPCHYRTLRMDRRGGILMPHRDLCFAKYVTGIAKSVSPPHKDDSGTDQHGFHGSATVLYHTFRFQKKLNEILNIRFIKLKQNRIETN